MGIFRIFFFHSGFLFVITVCGQLIVIDECKIQLFKVIFLQVFKYFEFAIGLAIFMFATEVF